MGTKIKRISFTKEGLDNLKKQYEQLLKDREPAVKELVRAREMGDLSENGLYKAARGRLSSIDANLRRISLTLKLAEVNEPTKGIVGIGSIAIITDGENKFEYTIVGAHEADPINKRISQNSPIGKALIGRKTNDDVVIRTPKKTISFKIILIK